MARFNYEPFRLEITYFNTSAVPVTVFWNGQEQLVEPKSSVHHTYVHNAVGVRTEPKKVGYFDVDYCEYNKLKFSLKYLTAMGVCRVARNIDQYSFVSLKEWPDEVSILNDLLSDAGFVSGTTWQWAMRGSPSYPWTVSGVFVGRVGGWSPKLYLVTNHGEMIENPRPEWFKHFDLDTY